MFVPAMLLLVSTLPDSYFAGDGAALCEAAFTAYQNALWSEAASLYERCEPLALTPLSHATTQTNLSIVLHKLEREEEAAESLRRAVEIWPSIPGTANEMARASLWLVEVERTLANFSAVERTLRAALGAHPSASLEAELHNRLAVVLRETGKTEEARAELQAVLAMPGITPGLEADALLGKAELDRHLMRYDESLDSLNRALKLAYDTGDPRVESDVLQGLGLTWMGQGDLSRAAPALKRSLALTETGAGSTPQRVGTALQCLAALYAKNHKYAMAEEELLRALNCLRTTLHEGHPQIAALMGDLAAVYRDENRLDEARRYADRAYSAMRGSLGAESIGAAEALGVIAGIEARQRIFGAASGHYALAIEMLRKQGAERDVRMAVLLVGYASVLDSQHRSVEAKQVRTDLNGFGFSNVGRIP